MRKIINGFKKIWQDGIFMEVIEKIEVFVSKILSIAMVIVIAVAIIDLSANLIKQLFSTNYGEFNTVLFKIFGLFLNILIALEILENITAYLRKHVVQVELVIVTSLIAISRKIIILDLNKVDGIDIIGLGTGVLALSISYWIIRASNTKN
ncbi:MAG: phosphate-starvation-inducible PsiE family protein [Richelia sp.]|nr:phosphate-starvation-inducible PsiE family protein [Richelia sp.]